MDMEGENHTKGHGRRERRSTFPPENTNEYQTRRVQNKEPQGFIQAQAAPNTTNVEPGVAGAQKRDV